MKATRQDAFSAIESERSYQNYRWPGHKHTVTEYLVYIQHYLNKAIAVASTSDSDETALAEVRKIAALGVAAMEENGAPLREGWF